ncbi:MAG: TetR/AcrR family transcriptional regulator [Gammaproteobacteria bacterium]|jgi:AcrR family transcriptional regulator|nr:MAG: TetR/AcrR family transcriptional regulator [Gammaproteobacteria bacterium]
MASEQKARTSYHHGDLKEALLLAAEALLEEEGVAGLTLRACARRAGVSHAAPKHHFKDASELLAEVAARSFDRLTGTLREDRAASVELDPESRIVSVFRAYVNFARRYPDHFRLMFRWKEIDRENEALAAASARTYAEMTTSVAVQRGDSDVSADTLYERIAEPGLQDDVLLAWGQIHGYAMLLLEGQFDGFAMSEGEDAFVERTVLALGARLSRVLRR